MNIQDKYNAFRSQIQNGDLMVFRGKGVLAKLIQYFDKATFNHIGIVWEANGRLFILDSNAPGVNPDFLSDRIKTYVDFSVIHIKKPDTDKALKLNLIMDKAQQGIKYNYRRLLRIAIYKKLKWQIKKLDGGEGRDICSQFAQEYTNLWPINCFKDHPLITPEDFLRSADGTEAEVLFNTNK